MKSSYKIVQDAPLLDEHTIVKLVGDDFIDRNARSIKTTIKGQFFLSRLTDKGCPSYIWLDFFTGTTENKLTQLREITTLKRGAKAVFAELNVGIVREKIEELIATIEQEEVRTQIASIDIIHDPDPEAVKNCGDYSHCVMTNIPNRAKEDAEEGYELSSTEEAVARIISRSVVDTHPAR